MYRYETKNNDESENAYYQYNLYKSRKINKILCIIATVILILGLGILFIKIFINDALLDISNAYLKWNNGPGELVCNILIVTALFLLIRIIFKNKKGLISLILSIVYLFYSLWSAGITLVQSAKLDAEKNKLAISEIAKIEHDFADGKDFSSIKLDRQTYGRLTPYLVLIKKYYTNEKQLDDNLTNQMKTLDLDNILAPATFSSADTIKNAQEKMKNYNKIFDDYKQKEIDEHNSMKMNISKLKVGSKFKQQVLHGFSESASGIEQDTDDMIKVENSVSEKVNSILDFMQSSQEDYRIQSNQIQFYSGSSLNKYNNYVSDLEELANEEQDIVAKINDRNKEHLSKLDKYLSKDTGLLDFFMNFF